MKDNELLVLTDVAARLPYDVYALFNLKYGDNGHDEGEYVAHILGIDFGGGVDLAYEESPGYRKDWNCHIMDIKPYLKRLETIDVNDYHKYLQENGYPIHSESVNIKCKDRWITYKDETPFFNYCLMNHYDYRGLIDKSLAIEVTEENNPYKKD